MAAERRVLVTGAGGFIGGRFVEALLGLEGFDVRPAVRRWSTAARIGRHPVDPVLCDLLDATAVAEATRGVESVIHCAVGDRRTTVEGTRNLLRGALENGVRRVVHISTIDVYGRAADVIREDHPMVRTGRSYGDSKIEAEEACHEFIAAGLEVVILRPTIVYGPFSDLWTIEFAVRFRDRTWGVPREGCQGRCNLVYVDDLVRAGILALDAPGASGEAFNINGPDDVTWQEYFDALHTALCLPPLAVPRPATSRLASAVVAPVRTAAKALYRRFESPIMAIYKRYRTARRLMKWLEATLRKAPSGAELDLYGRVAHFPTTKAEAVLGYRPRVDMRQGIRLSAEWLVHEGIIEPPAP